MVIRLQLNSPICPEGQFLPVPVQFFADGWHISTWAEKPLSASSLSWDRIDSATPPLSPTLEGGIVNMRPRFKRKPWGPCCNLECWRREKHWWLSWREWVLSFLLRKKAINIFHCIIVHITSCILEVILFICTYGVLVRFVVICFLLLLASLLFNGLGFCKHRWCLMGWQFQSVTISGCRMG